MKTYTEEELLALIADDLRAVMRDFGVDCRTIMKWCDVSRHTVESWRRTSPYPPRRHQIVYHLRRFAPGKFRDGVRGGGDQKLVEALQWYADHNVYSPAAPDRRLPNVHDESDITVYRKAVLCDRGARARAALKEVGL